MSKEKRRQSHYLKAASFLAATSVVGLLGEQVVQAEEQVDAGLSAGDIAVSSETTVQTENISIVSAESVSETTEIPIETPELTYSETGIEESPTPSTEEVTETPVTSLESEQAVSSESAISEETPLASDAVSMETTSSVDEEPSLQETKALATKLTTTNQLTPYITIERYGETQESYKQNGSLINLLYKTGVTNIDKNDFELTPDALALGLTYDAVNQYIRGTIALDGSLENRRYLIGLQSKTDSSIGSSVSLTLQTHFGFVLGQAPDVLKFPRMNQSYISDSDQNKVVSGAKLDWYYSYNNIYSYKDPNTGAYDTTKPATDVTIDGLSLPVTTFGYYMSDGQTIADAGPTTPQYYSDFVVFATDSRTIFDTPLTIKNFTQTGGSEGVELKLLTVYDLDEVNYYRAEDRTSHTTHGKETTPYYIRFVDLPDKAGTYYVTFEIEDSLGLKKSFRLNFSTYERSRAESNKYTPLTSVDISFQANSDYKIDGVNHVVIPIAQEAQDLATLVLNKQNASINVVSLPEGIEFDETSNTIRKKAGVFLNPGMYTAEFSANDGHFGANTSNRILTFEVTDVINPIGHQVWQFGEAIPTIALSTEANLPMVSIQLEQSDTSSVRLKTEAWNKRILGEALSPTTEVQWVTVVIGYTNNLGGISYTKTKFSYEVQPAQLDIDVSATPASQSVAAGDSIVPITIIKSMEGTLVIDVNNLPRGLRYNAESQTISGRGLDEGVYTIPIRVEKDNKFIEKTVSLTVTPGSFIVEDISVVLMATSPLPEDFSLEIPQGEKISIYWDTIIPGLLTDKEYVYGIPSREGTHTMTATIAGVTGGGGIYKQTTATVTVTVLPRPLSLDVSLPNQEVAAFDEITPIKVSYEGNLESSYILSDTGYTLSGMGLVYDTATGLISGKPLFVGTHTFTLKSFYQDIYTDYNEQKIEKTFTITVHPLDMDVTASHLEQTVDLMTPIIDVEISHNGRLDSSGWTRVPNESELAGLTLSERDGKYYLSGRPNRLGTIELVFEASYSAALGGVFDREMVILHVTDSSRDLTIDGNNQVVQVLDAISPIRLSHPSGTSVRIDGDFPSGVSYDSQTNTLEGVPTHVGIYNIPVTVVTDGAANSVPTASYTITLQVTQLPVSIEVSNGDQTVTKGNAITPIVVSHSEGSTLYLRTPFGDLTEDRLVDYLLDQYGLTYNKETNTVSGQASQTGIVRLRFFAQNPIDHGGATEAATAFVMTVSDDLAITASNDRQMLVLGSPIRPIVISHTDGSTITLDTSSLPEGLTYDPTTKTISGQPLSVGQSDILISAEKNGKTVSHIITLDVFEVGKTTVTIDSVDGTWVINGVDTNQPSRGETGISGNTVTTTASDPLSTDGKEGDTHINGLTGDVFVKESGIWVLKGNLKGAKGDQGEAGQNGQDGVDGQSLTIIRTEHDASGNTLLTFSDGTTVTVGKGDQGEAGQDGKDGADGQSLTIIRTEHDASGNTLLTFSDGTTVTVAKGDQGEAGQNGQDGKDGVDGESLTIVRTERDASGNTLLTFSDGTTVTVAKGDQGEAGQDGKDGADGQSLTIIRTEHDASGNTLLTFSDGTTVTVGKGDQGEAGQDGADGQSLTIVGTEHDASGNTLLTFSDGTTVTVAKGDQGEAGQDGVDGQSLTIVRTERDASGNTLLTFSDGTTVTVAKGDQGEAGQNGKDGVDGQSLTIVRTERDASGNTLLTFSDGTTVTVAKGDQGEAGQNGQDGKDGVDGQSLTIVRTERDASGNTLLTFSDGTTVTVAKGDEGVAGRNGNTITASAGSPTAQDGQDGDIHINTKTGDILRKEAGSWIIISSTSIFTEPASADNSGSGATSTGGSSNGTSSVDTGSNSGHSANQQIAGGNTASSANVSATVNNLPFISSESFVNPTNTAMRTGGSSVNTNAISDSARLVAASTLPSTGDEELSFAPLAGFTALLFGGVLSRKRKEEK